MYAVSPISCGIAEELPAGNFEFNALKMLIGFALSATKRGAENG